MDSSTFRILPGCHFNSETIDTASLQNQPKSLGECQDLCRASFGCVALSFQPGREQQCTLSYRVPTVEQDEEHELKLIADTLKHTFKLMSDRGMTLSTSDPAWNISLQAGVYQAQKEYYYGTEGSRRRKTTRTVFKTVTVSEKPMGLKWSNVRPRESEGSRMPVLRCAVTSAAEKFAKHGYSRQEGDMVSAVNGLGVGGKNSTELFQMLKAATMPFNITFERRVALSLSDCRSGWHVLLRSSKPTHGLKVSIVMSDTRALSDDPTKYWSHAVVANWVYAKRHGYQFKYYRFPEMYHAEIGDMANCWNKVIALQLALTENPKSHVFMYLDSDAYVRESYKQVPEFFAGASVPVLLDEQNRVHGPTLIIAHEPSATEVSERKHLCSHSNPDELCTTNDGVMFFLNTELDLLQDVLLGWWDAAKASNLQQFANVFPHEMAILNSVMLPKLQQQDQALLLSPFEMNSCSGIFVRHLWGGCVLKFLRERLATDTILAAFFAGELDDLLTSTTSAKIQRSMSGVTNRMDTTLEARDVAVRLLLAGLLPHVPITDMSDEAKAPRCERPRGPRSRLGVSTKHNSAEHKCTPVFRAEKRGSGRSTSLATGICCGSVEEQELMDEL
jgi:hypothetical protein